MQFEFTEQQRMIRDMARDFAQQHIVPGAALETIITRSAVQPGGQVDAAGHLHGVVARLGEDHDSAGWLVRTV